ncbi:hypothetical protein Hypma_001988 [Hypsizygus marmoreus]|uniref:Cytochrome P450 n=1 Tax=Hypsizygus marmoreus TaxID=39966 RepID=A0A369J7L5_HYPMA|nr:hypothetical protein Hypma_001988 [Hypsizygus marmoreus]
MKGDDKIAFANHLLTRSFSVEILRHCNTRIPLPPPSARLIRCWPDQESGEESDSSHSRPAEAVFQSAVSVVPTAPCEFYSPPVANDPSRKLTRKGLESASCKIHKWVGHNADLDKSYLGNDHLHKDFFGYLNDVNIIQSSKLTMLRIISQAAVALCTLWLTRWVLKCFTRKSTLHNVRGPARDSWLLGNLARVYDFNAFKTHRIFEEEYGSVMKFYGVLGEEQLYISDPKALYHIFLKDQDIYVEPEEYYIVNHIHFGDGIFSSHGEKHRRQRKLLSPAFNIAHMRQLTPIFYEVTNKLKDAFKMKLVNGSQEIDVLSWMTRIALELIGQAGLGYSFDDLTDGGSPSAFARAVKELFPTEDRMLLARQYILPWVANIGSPRFRRFVVDTLPWKTLHEVRDIVDVLHDHVNRIYAEKKKAFSFGDEAFFSQQPGRGKDVISTLMKANKVDFDKNGISDAEVTGHMACV